MSVAAAEQLDAATDVLQVVPGRDQDLGEAVDELVTVAAEAPAASELLHEAGFMSGDEDLGLGRGH